MRRDGDAQLCVRVPNARVGRAPKLLLGAFERDAPRDLIDFPTVWPPSRLLRQRWKRSGERFERQHVDLRVSRGEKRG